MNKVWKWIIGIVLGLVVVALLVGAGLWMRGNFHSRGLAFSDCPGLQVRRQGMVPFDGQGNFLRGHRLMGGHMGVFPFGGFLGSLTSLGILTLIVLGIIWMIRSLRRPVPAANSACPNCGKSVLEIWRNCPYCGKKL